MEIKKADNINIDYREKISKIDDDIDIERAKLKKLDEMQEELVAINRNMEACIDLLAASMKGKKTVNMYKELYYTNRNACRNIGDKLEKNNYDATKKMNNLYKNKYALIAEHKRQMIEEENNKE